MKTTENRMLKIICSLLLTLNSLVIGSQNFSSGLQFASHSAIKEDRTSLALAPKFDASQGFMVDFDIKLRSEVHNYGYVFRIIIDDERSFDLIANFSPGKRTLNLIEGNNIYLSFPEKKLNDYQWNKWAHIQCFIAPDAVKLSFDGQILEETYKPLSIDQVQFYFGYSNHHKFHSSDVPPMSIRNIKITNKHHKTIAYWPLKKHSLNSCLDSLHQLPATVTNPTWEINKHTKWTKELALTLPAQTQICHASPFNTIYFANNASILAFSTTHHRMDTIYPVQGTPYFERNNQLIYHPYYNELWSYDFDLKAISYFDFQSRTWANSDSEIKNPEYSQHNTFISPDDSCLYIFGGYGNYQYKNKILKKGRFQDDWQSVSYEEKIPPRYLSGLGYKNKDTLLVFGGCGNPKGKQELGIINYYDLYAIDVHTMNTKKLWSISSNETNNFVVGNGIIVDEKYNKIYALCFPNDCSNNYILLKSFNLDNGKEMTNYADTIPFVFNDVNSFCTLYYDSLQSHLYAVTSHRHEDKSNINVYSLAYPPLQIEETLQEVAGNRSYPLVILLVASGCLLIGVGYFVFIRRKRRNRPLSQQTISPSSSASKETEVVTEVIATHKQSSIIFLDGFQVWDRDGRDITKLFTPILKQLLILIILYSEDSKKGISNVTLRELLWFDKMDESAQNNRRVNIRKLKLLLEKLDGVEMVKENTYWSMQFTQTYCDYIEVSNFINQLKNNLQVTAENIQNIPLTLLAGQLLPYIQTDWLDRFKSDYSNAVLDSAIKLSKQEYIRNNNELLIRIANTMFAHDKTDENALILKCQALYHNGRTGLAKASFDAFCNEYKATLNTEYAKSFNDIINS